jgi:hypothetical protein
MKQYGLRDRQQPASEEGRVKKSVVFARVFSAATNFVARFPLLSALAFFNRSLKYSNILLIYGSKGWII